MFEKQLICFLWLEQVTVELKAIILHNTFLIAQKELLINVLSYEGVIEKKVYDSTLKIFFDFAED